MGFGRKLRKLGGKLLKAAVTVAPMVASGGTLAPIGAIAGSKLRSMGENRSRRRLATKLTKGEGLQAYAKELKVASKSMNTNPRTAPRPRARELVAMRDPAARALLNAEQAKGRKSLVTSRAVSSRGAKAKWAELDAETREALQAEFKAAHPKGTAKQWSDFVVANA